MKGPDSDHEDRQFLVESLRAGAIYDVTLDFTAMDKRKVVTVNWVTAPVDYESMRAYADSFF